MAKVRVLVCLASYHPDHDATGPNQSMRAMAKVLADTHEFYVLGAKPLGLPHGTDVRPEWCWDGFCFSRQLPSPLRVFQLLHILRSFEYDVLMMSSVFDPRLSIPVTLIRRLRLAVEKPIVLSVRGELARGALSLKGAKKRAYLSLVRAAKLFSSVQLHASSSGEFEDIQRADLYPASILFARDASLLFESPEHTPAATGDALRVMFLGRVARVKNVDKIIDILSRVDASIRLQIVGPLIDTLYWQDCENMIAGLSPNIEVDVLGSRPLAEVPTLLAANDLMFLPTKGENFGHAILESLTAGTPVLISDQTPWRGLAARKAGWDLPLDNPQAFVDVIEAFARMSADERAKWRAGARAMAEDYYANNNAAEEIRDMINTVIAAGP